MAQLNNRDDGIVIQDDSLYNKKTEPIPKPEINIGIDTKNQLIDNIVDTYEDNYYNHITTTTVDISQINSFTQMSQKRNEIYAMLDTMCQDSKVSSILRTCAEDSTEYNDQSQIVWCESSDAKCAAYVSFLIDTLRLDKNIYAWAYSLCKYGDLYVQLFKQSEIDQAQNIFDNNSKKKKKKLDEEIRLNLYKENDNFAHYVEMYPNPADIFELVQFGKTVGYIKTDIAAYSENEGLVVNTFKYRFRKGDINIYPANKFVHAALQDDTPRIPEEVVIFRNNKDYETSNNGITYRVNRGKSIFYDVFKIWRMLSLLENSILLNRLTKTSITRVVNVEIGDMPKQNVGPLLNRLKQMMEQRTAINVGDSLNEYTNPGPYENIIYNPVHEGKGAVSQDTIGGDVNIGELPDVDYFLNSFYGSLGIPKQYFGQTSDAAGFSGGQSLAILSSRYAKMVKRIQNTLCQLITDIINLMLIDKGMTTYVNNFTIKMQPPTTQEEIDRRDNTTAKVGMVRDIMDLLSEVTDPVIKMTILKSLLASGINNPEVIELIQKQIEQIEQDEENKEQSTSEQSSEESFENIPDFRNDLYNEEPESEIESDNTPLDLDQETEVETIDTSEEEYNPDLPSPEDLGIDLTSPENI